MSTDADAELLITGKQFNEMLEMRQDPIFIGLCRDQLAVDSGKGITVFGDNRDLSPAQIIRNLPNLMFEKDVLLSFVDNPMNGELYELKQFIRKHIDSHPVFDGELPYSTACSIVHSEYNEHGTKVRELFDSLTAYERYTDLEVIRQFDAFVKEMSCTSGVNSVTGIEVAATERGISIPNSEPSFNLGKALLITEDGRVYNHPADITHLDFTLNTVIHIANGEVSGPKSCPHGSYDRLSLFDVVQRYRDFDNQATVQPEQKRYKPF